MQRCATGDRCCRMRRHDRGVAGGRDARMDGRQAGGRVMKRQLLASSALIGVGLVATPASAADGVKLSVGGFFNEAYQVVFDDDGEGEAGNEHNTDGFFNSAEVHFMGSTV